MELGSGISEVIKFIRHDIALMAPCEEELTELGGSFATALSIKRGTMACVTLRHHRLGLDVLYVDGYLTPPTGGD
ncbi:hypothetical protein F2P81_008580 [Scophthalmus maximus]|uniref:Uncharacterized protein n=1 Tax=Scophthalmus maximus TaxID=52904 RepID=A0A6A4SSC5_SCOMX|nr:hypothetical protein F2P81_008580 [Scophthalmus maximus]